MTQVKRLPGLEYGLFIKKAMRKAVKMETIGPARVSHFFKSKRKRTAAFTQADLDRIYAFRERHGIRQPGDKLTPKQRAVRTAVKIEHARKRPKVTLPKLTFLEGK